MKYIKYYENINPINQILLLPSGEILDIPTHIFNLDLKFKKWNTDYEMFTANDSDKQRILNFDIKFQEWRSKKNKLKDNKDKLSVVNRIKSIIKWELNIKKHGKLTQISKNNYGFFTDYIKNISYNGFDEIMNFMLDDYYTLWKSPENVIIEKFLFILKKEHPDFYNKYLKNNTSFK